jgi:hypothetical protein
VKRKDVKNKTADRFGDEIDLRFFACPEKGVTTQYLSVVTPFSFQLSMSRTIVS